MKTDMFLGPQHKLTLKNQFIQECLADITHTVHLKLQKKS